MLIFIDRNVIYLIVKHISFDDILSLSKTCTTFNKMLKHKYSIVWDLNRLKQKIKMHITLSELYLTENLCLTNAKILPSDIGLLISLKYLYVYQVKTLPIEITKLTNLLSLYVDIRTKIPDEIRNMPKLSIFTSFNSDFFLV